MLHASRLPAGLLGKGLNDVSEKTRPLAAPKKFSTGARQIILDRVRRFDFRSHSDGDLTNAMPRLKHRAQHLGIDEILPEAFAMVNEAIRRSLDIQVKVHDEPCLGQEHDIPSQEHKDVRPSPVTAVVSGRLVPRERRCLAP